MFGSAFQRLVPVTVLLMLVASFTTHADAPVASASAESYQVLARLGLLKNAPTQAQSPPKAVRISTVLPPTSHPAPAVASSEVVVERSSSAAYDVLHRLGLLAAPAHAVPKSTTVHRQRMRVLVEKSKRRLYVLRDGKPVLEYPVMLGGEPSGPKREAGDLRTPEGLYTLDWRNPKSRFYKSIHISYPGPQDRVHAEERGVDPGGMIMLHGEHDDPAMRRILRRRARDWTEGCIAINNDAMDEIWRAVPDGTPIEIRP